MTTNGKPEPVQPSGNTPSICSKCRKTRELQKVGKGLYCAECWAKIAPRTPPRVKDAFEFYDKIYHPTTGKNPGTWEFAEAYLEHGSRVAASSKEATPAREHICEAELFERGPSDGYAKDGERWTCSCGKIYEHFCDEASGCQWNLYAEATPSPATKETNESSAKWCCKGVSTTDPTEDQHEPHCQYHASNFRPISVAPSPAREEATTIYMAWAHRFNRWLLEESGEKFHLGKPSLDKLAQFFADAGVPIRRSGSPN